MINHVKIATVLASAVVFAGVTLAQQDPGAQSAVRTGTFDGITVSPGEPLINLSSDTTGYGAFFTDGLKRFQEVEGVADNAAGNNGLGPRFNFNQCAGCHGQPAVGGSGMAVNPQVAGVGSCASTSNLSEAAVTVIGSGSAPTPTQKGTIACNTTNTVPSFLTASGPTREARFPFFFTSSGTVNTSAPNGGVEDLFVVSGRPDGATASGCAITQPNFTLAESTGNIIFRIPTPVFGDGLIENLDDSMLLENQETNLTNGASLGISGSFNRSGNDGTITKFGWKAQNKSAHIFAGEAYNVEMGITNLLFNNERPNPEEENQGTGLASDCLNLTGTGYPEDTSNPVTSPVTNGTAANNAAVLDDVSAFGNFMRLLAPPPTGTVILNGSAVPAATISAGQALFSSIGCNVCHSPTLGPTMVSNFVPALSKQTFNPYSDFEIHDMGAGFADNVSQGNAGGDQFRTAPLWGLGQRIFLDPDGRDQSLPAAIQNHASSGSEANSVITNYNNLSATQKQELIDFLRSL